MDRIEKALWTQLRHCFPPHAVIVHADESSFVVDWLAEDDRDRPQQRVQKVALRVDRTLRKVLAQADHIELERIAVNASRLVQNAMHRYPDSRDPAHSFVIDLGDSLNDV